MPKNIDKNGFRDLQMHDIYQIAAKSERLRCLVMASNFIGLALVGIGGYLLWKLEAPTTGMFAIMWGCWIAGGITLPISYHMSNKASELQSLLTSVTDRYKIVDKNAEVIDAGMEICMDTAAAAEKCRSFVENSETISDSDPEAGKGNLIFIIDEIVGGRVAGGTAQRWLGYLQGILVGSHSATLKEMRKINRKA